VLAAATVVAVGSIAASVGVASSTIVVAVGAMTSVVAVASEVPVPVLGVGVAVPPQAATLISNINRTINELSLRMLSSMKVVLSSAGMAAAAARCLADSMLGYAEDLRIAFGENVQ
jgi:hypothetical protein